MSDTFIQQIRTLSQPCNSSTVSIYPSNNQQINQSVNQTNQALYQSVPLTAQSNNQAINIHQLP